MAKDHDYATMSAFDICGTYTHFTKHKQNVHRSRFVVFCCV